MQDRVSPRPECLQKLLGYWTYEVCLGTEILQFHSVVRGMDRKQITSLGKHDAAASTPEGQLRYANGDVCEPSKRRREATVNVVCGNSDRVIDVGEPEACRYIINVELKSACPPADAQAQPA